MSVTRPVHSEGPGQLGLERIVFFSDAVMAIAITLLAVDIKVPELPASVARAELPGQLSALGPSISSFVISFLVIGIHWLRHHRYFTYIKRYDYGLALLNLLFLLFIAAMPFVSGLLGEYPYLSLGVVTYSAEVAGIGFSLAALWWHASRRHRLIDVDADPAAIRTENIRALAAPIMFLIAIPFGLLRPWLGIVVWWLSPLAVIGATRWLMRKA